MKHLFLSILIALIGFQAFSKESHDVTLKLRYKGNPLCYWSVVLLQGINVVGKGVSDENGNVTFRSVTLVSKEVDAKGYKKTDNGDKEWTIAGMIDLDQNYTAILNFENLMGEMAKSNPMVADIWGLTLNDCPGQKTSSNSESSKNKNNSGENKVESNVSIDYPGKGAATQILDAKRARDQYKADQAARKAQQQQALQQKIERLNKKIQKCKTEKVKYTPGTTEYSDACYELRDFEYDRELAQLKLDEINDAYAADKGKLDKDERKRYDEQTEKLETKQKELRQNKKAGILYQEDVSENVESKIETSVKTESINNTSKKEEPTSENLKKEEKVENEKTEITEQPVKEPEEVSASENELEKEKKELEKEKEELEREKAKMKKEKEELEKGKEKEKNDKKKKEEEEEDDAPFKIYTSEELANLSSFDLKRTRLGNKNSVNKREVKLKVKSSFYSQEKIAKLKGEIESLNKQVEAINKILAQRNEKEETEEGK